MIILRNSPASGIQDNEAQIGIEGLKNNRQGLDLPAQIDNHAGAEESNTAVNHQGLENGATLDNHSALPEDESSNNRQGVHEEGLASNTAAIPNNSENDNNASIANAGHRDNIAEIATDIESANVADIQHQQPGVHRETLPDATLGGTQDGSDQDGFGHPRERGYGTGARILQTHPTPSNLSGLPQGTSASSGAQGARVAQAGAVASTKATQNTNKSGAKVGSAAARAKEVPKASDTWSEAFRGRVAAINDQVKSLNHKLDEFDK